MTADERAAPQAAGTPPRPPKLRPPLRRGIDTPVAGVCLGLSRHLSLSVPVVRAIMIGLAIAGGVGIFLYGWLWIFVPREDEPVAEAGVRGLSGPAVEQPQSPPGQTAAPGAGDEHGAEGETFDAEALRQRTRRLAHSLTSSPEVLLGGLLLGGAAVFGMQMLGVNINWWMVIPPVALVAGVLLAWSQLDASGFEAAGDAGQRKKQATAWQVGAGTVLVVIAMLVLAGGLLPAGDILLGLVVAVMLLAGIALVAAPWLVKLYRTMTTARARAAAEAERADIAAHLHDSVLQTLAMIQKQKQDASAVERLARSQERQLRSWLYRQHHRGEAGSSTESLKDRFLAVAAELEELHSVPVEVVAVGQSRRTDHRALVAAGREAIVNALKHAGPASVYMESNEQEDAVFIRDRGPGFELTMIEQDRLGVRESIIGRMRRAGGEARIRSGERGTEVQLFMPVSAGAAGSSEGNKHRSQSERSGPDGSGSGSPPSGNTRSGHIVPEHTAVDHTALAQAEPDHTEPDHTEPEHTAPDHTASAQAAVDCAGPGQAESGQTGPENKEQESGR